MAVSQCVADVLSLCVGASKAGFIAFPPRRRRHGGNLLISNQLCPSDLGHIVGSEWKAVYFQYEYVLETHGLP